MAFANKSELAGEYVATSKDGFALAHESSVYTLVSLSRFGRPLMQAAGGGSVVTLSYLGAERVVTNYNVMGVLPFGDVCIIARLAARALNGDSVTPPLHPALHPGT